MPLSHSVSQPPCTSHSQPPARTSAKRHILPATAWPLRNKAEKGRRAIDWQYCLCGRISVVQAASAHSVKDVNGCISARQPLPENGAWCESAADAVKPDYHRCKNFIDQVRAYHRIATDSTRFCPIECIQATNKSLRFLSRRRTAQYAAVQRRPFRKRNNHAADNDFWQGAKPTPRASQPATRPMTIATGANAARSGRSAIPRVNWSVNRSASRHRTKQYRANKCADGVEKYRYLTMLASCPPIILMAIEITITPAPDWKSGDAP